MRLHDYVETERMHSGTQGVGFCWLAVLDSGRYVHIKLEMHMGMSIVEFILLVAGIMLPSRGIYK